MAGTTPTKRTNWRASDDLMLLRQTAADTPFKHKRGHIQPAWDRLASTLMSCEEFTRTLDGKKAQSRFTALIEVHRSFNRTSATLSGTTEAESEKIQLLDDLTALYDDVKQEVDAKTEQSKQEKVKNETSGAYIRDEAMKNCVKRQRTDDKSHTLFEVIKNEGDKEVAIRAKEIEFKKFKFEQEIIQRQLDREERKAEREERIMMSKMEAEKTMALFKALLASK
jgi:hypothetical protein